jgi:hypothetical protein
VGRTASPRTNHPARTRDHRTCLQYPCQPALPLRDRRARSGLGTKRSKRPPPAFMRGISGARRSLRDPGLPPLGHRSARREAGGGLFARDGPAVGSAVSNAPRERPARPRRPYGVPVEQDKDPVVTALANALVFLTGYVDEREVPDETPMTTSRRWRSWSAICRKCPTQCALASLRFSGTRWHTCAALSPGPRNNPDQRAPPARLPGGRRASRP